MPMSLRPNRSGQGFTVVEVLIAAAVLLVGLLAVASMIPTGSTNVDQAGRMSSAVAVAQQSIEWVKNSAFPPTAGNCSGTVPASYTCSVGVTNTGSSPNRLATVTVTVTWVNSQRSGNVSLVTRIAE